MIALYSLILILPNWVGPTTLSARRERVNHKVVIGYVLDEDDSSYGADQIDWSKITHLNVAFANPIDAEGNLLITPHIKQLVERAHKSKVKILVSIGGGSASENKKERDRYFDLMSDAKRGTFVHKLVDYVHRYRLDGLDVDLEGPAIGKDYSAFIGDLSKALRPKRMLLTAAVSGGNGGDQVKSGALACFDFVNVMAYDATGPWEPNHPGQHSSLNYAKECVAYWIGRGVLKSKLVLGVPFYGWGFGSAFTEGGYKFAQIVDKYPGSEMNDQAGSTIWYNGIPTIQAKVKYVIAQDLAGVMIWSLEQDAKGRLSLLAAIHDALAAR